MSLQVQKLDAWFGNHQVLKSVSLDVADREIVALIGPSGCGKSTFLRCLNRLHEEVKGARSQGAIVLNGKNINDPKVDAVDIRRHIGMVFQKPVPFPGLSIFENAVIGLKLNGISKKSMLQEQAEVALKKAALWNEVKDKLDAPGTSLSGGQQQRLCMARALAVNPPILLMDEPTSALDPISTASIEELILELKKSVTVIIVTHNMQQARRVADRTAFFLLGDLVEVGSTEQIFTNPRHPDTQRYISGSFG